MKIKRLIDYNLCLGCGLCQSIYPSKCEILLDKDGFYKPVFRENLTYVLPFKSEEISTAAHGAIYFIYVKAGPRIVTFAIKRHLEV